MKYHVQITDTAQAELEQAFQWLQEQSKVAAESWRAKLIQAIRSLERNPMRCGLAPEAEDLPIEVRQFLYGRKLPDI